MREGKMQCTCMVRVASMGPGREVVVTCSGNTDRGRAAFSITTDVRAAPRQMHQAKLFENQVTRNGIRYGRSQHLHFVSSEVSSPETNNGARMVQSTMTEMLANVRPLLKVEYLDPRD